ncbi:MAG: hypothetical protein [Arizlama microvirus]|nr:MAG: hypothetical protein [Arizlama microvirus]
MSKSKKSKNRHTRDTFVISNQKLRLPDSILNEDFTDLVALTEIEDNRQFLPSFRSPRRLTTLPARLQPRPVKSRSVAYTVGFEDPTNVVRCVRKKIRKQVLHAFNKTGKGGQRKPRLNLNFVRC